MTNLGFELDKTAAAPKRRNSIGVPVDMEFSDEATQVPMREGKKLRRNPSTDQKKVRRKIQRQGSHDEPDKEIAMNREAEILHAMAHASLEDQRVLAKELAELRAQKSAQRSADRSVELSDAVISDHLTPVMTHTLHTAATDWIGEVDDAGPAQDMDHVMRTEATLWFNRTSSEVKADRDEFAEQAMGIARRLGGQYGDYAPNARQAFLDQVAHLHSRFAKGDSPGKVDEDQSGNAESQITDYDTEEEQEAFLGEDWENKASEVPSDRAPVIQENKTGKVAAHKCPQCGTATKASPDDKTMRVCPNCYWSGWVKQAASQTCSVCGASIERDPAGEEPRTWHHADGKKHDHEAKPKSESGKKQSSVAADSFDEALFEGDGLDFPKQAASTRYYLLYPKGGGSPRIFTAEADPTGQELGAQGYGFAEGPFYKKQDAVARSRWMNNPVTDETAIKLAVEQDEPFGYKNQLRGCAECGALKDEPHRPYCSKHPSHKDDPNYVNPDKGYDKKSALQAQAQQHRPLYEIAAEILSDWKKPWFGAVPYLRAMATLNTIDDMYGADDAFTIVSYFLGNAAQWRGETARRVKAELKSMIADYKKRKWSSKTAETKLVDCDECDGGYQEDGSVCDACSGTGKIWVEEESGPAKKQSADEREQAGHAETSTDQVEVGDPNDRPMWPWELTEEERKAQEAADVADVHTPGQDIADYPQPTASRKTAEEKAQVGTAVCCDNCGNQPADGTQCGQGCRLCAFGTNYCCDGMTCPSCHGQNPFFYEDTFLGSRQGAKYDKNVTGPDACSRCNGKGYVEELTGEDTWGGADYLAVDCPHCGGSGREPDPEELAERRHFHGPEASLTKGASYGLPKYLDTPENNKKMERCVEEVKKKGDVDNPYAVCKASIMGTTKKSSTADQETINRVALLMAEARGDATQFEQHHFIAAAGNDNVCAVCGRSKDFMKHAAKDPGEDQWERKACPTCGGTGIIHLVKGVQSQKCPTCKGTGAVSVKKKGLRTEAKIVRKDGKWCVQSHSGKNMGCYDSEGGAKKRLQQVEFFKRKGEKATETSPNFPGPGQWDVYDRASKKRIAGPFSTQQEAESAADGLEGTRPSSDLTIRHGEGTTVSSLSDIASQKATAFRDTVQANLDKEAFPNPLELGVKVGDIFDYSWGYDQTQVEFYEVVAVTPASVKVRRVASKDVAAPENFHEARVPIKGKFLGDTVYTKRIKTGYQGTPGFAMAHGWASLWDGTPQYQTNAYAGH